MVVVNWLGVGDLSGQPFEQCQCVNFTLGTETLQNLDVMAFGTPFLIIDPDLAFYMVV